MKIGHVNDITGEVVGFIILNGFSDTVLADYFWARAVILTSPTIATIGMSITIPIALLTDYFIKGVSATWISGLGASLVVIGFVLVNLTPSSVQNCNVCNSIRRFYPNRTILSSVDRKVYDHVQPAI
jgi:drug/metabolite transporter (DMT)-like permease